MRHCKLWNKKDQKLKKIKGKRLKVWGLANKDWDTIQKTFIFTFTAQYFSHVHDTKGDTQSYWACLTGPQYIESKKEKNCIMVHWPIKQAKDERCISDRNWDTAGFVTRDVPTPTKHEFLREVGEWKRFSAHGLVTTRWLWRGKACACCHSWWKKSMRRKWKSLS